MIHPRTRLYERNNTTSALYQTYKDMAERKCTVMARAAGVATLPRFLIQLHLLRGGMGMKIFRWERETR
jgi:hypothetical protein